MFHHGDQATVLFLFTLKLATHCHERIALARVLVRTENAVLPDLIQYFAVSVRYRMAPLH